MRNDYQPDALGTQKGKERRLLGEQTLLLLCAAVSLAFVIYYSWAGRSASAHTPSAPEATAPASPPMVASQPQQLEDAPATPNAVSDVVSKALAFKALLTTAQQSTLQQTYTSTLARRWSNLPCGSNCRNGIQLGTLTAAQQAAALEVIQAAAGTAANEGSAEFQQIRLADTFLQSNGGGNNYNEGIYFLSFLNTPSTTSPWMLQYGGHHYGANIAYNNGHVVSGTPLFEALEPLSFTVNGTTYTPLAQEQAALANMLASLSAAQLTTARLTSTFSDVTLAPGESNGGSGVFPSTKVGLQVSTLSEAQKLLVLEAIKPWVQDLDDTVAANLLSIYQNELNGTFIAYTGNGTSGNASSFLNANTNYARIDGPTVWIEFICQNGIVFRNQIHYHSVFRDHVRDYGADLSLTTPLDTGTFSFTASTATVSEGAGATTLTVNRTGDISLAASVDYATADGTALQRTDYTLAAGTLNFAAGEASKTVTVIVTDDLYVNSSRNLTIALSNPVGTSVALASPSTLTLTITDNDTTAPTTNPLDTASYFVQQHYADFLSRVPDSGGLSYWSGQITGCGTDTACTRTRRVGVSNAFFFEQEYQQTGAYTFRLFRAAYGNTQPAPNPDTTNTTEANKLPNYAAYAALRACVVGGSNLAAGQLSAATALTQQAAFISKYPTTLDAGGFVDAVLATISNGSGVSLTSQRTALISLFNSGGRAAVMYRLADDSSTNPITNQTFIDAEYNRAFVYTEYTGYLRRDSDIAGFLFWLAQVNAGPLRDTTRQNAMVCSFITSAEYQQRFSSIITRTNSECPQ